MYCRNCGSVMGSTIPECPICGSLGGGGKNYCQECGTPSEATACICTRCGCELRMTLADGSMPVSTFSEAVKSGFKKYAKIGGRANRVEYWMWWLFVLIATAFVGIGWLMLPVLIIPTLCITARRLHDVGKSGWWLLVGIIPIANLYILYLLLQRGESGDNRYGISPSV